jgi:hypothetical protein
MPGEAQRPQDWRGRPAVKAPFADTARHRDFSRHRLVVLVGSSQRCGNGEPSRLRTGTFGPATSSTTPTEGRTVAPCAREVPGSSASASRADLAGAVRTTRRSPGRNAVGHDAHAEQADVVVAAKVPGADPEDVVTQLLQRGRCLGGRPP